MSSKAQGLSLNTIIIATIVLIVLLFLILIFTGYFNKRWGPGFTDLSDASCKGRVISDTASCKDTERQDYSAGVKAGEKCCITTGCVPYSCTAPHSGKAYDMDCSTYDDPINCA
ncbi:TPA: hypothetical protein HA231_04105 [Candidatus Woesearchaeota archaeon]|nr:hypothetical protein [Candidatus Woesearchaeota archaeon]